MSILVSLFVEGYTRPFVIHSVNDFNGDGRINIELTKADVVECLRCLTEIDEQLRRDHPEEMKRIDNARVIPFNQEAWDRALSPEVNRTQITASVDKRNQCAQ